MSVKQTPVVRIAEQSDKKDFRKLWDTCFGDSSAFCDWFFENRFAAEYSVVLEADDKIYSCMQAFPYTILIRGKEVPGAMLCGVSTDPSERKKGYMGKIFSFEMNHLRQSGCMVTPHTPAILPSYFSFGHFPVADAAYLKCNEIPFLHKSENIYTIEEKDWNELYPLYDKFSQKYSGIIRRTRKDFLRKAADYAADGGKSIAYIEKGSIKAYAFYYQTETEILCAEAVADDGYWEALIEGLFAIGSGLKFTAKLPPEVDISFPYTILKRVQKGVMGLCNASALLQALNLSVPYGFRLVDPVVPENNECFDFSGEPYTEPVVFEISAGHLLQVLVGYQTLNELKDEIKVFDEIKFKEINDLLPKLNCYIIDEY